MTSSRAVPRFSSTRRNAGSSTVVMETDQGNSPSRIDARDWLCVFAALAVAAMVFQPWAGRSLPLPDFGTFLPLLDGSQGLVTQLAAVTSFYAAEGRLCVFPYMLFVFGANIFGTWAPGWYLTYFVLNSAVITLFWLVLRRMRVPRTAVFLSVALWIPMTATTELWLRPTGEPFALIFFLAAVLLATSYGSSSRWRRDAIIIAVLCIALIYSKEILVTLLPAGWVVSRIDFSGDRATWREWGSRDSFLISIVTAVVILALIPIGWVAATAGDGSYASGFGEEGVAGKVVQQRLAMVLLPTKSEIGSLAKVAADPGWFLLLALPNLAWTWLLAGGLWTGGKALTWPLVIAALWAGVGLLAYSPWTDPQTFYMAPFALGTMFGTAHIAGSLVRRSKASTAGALAIGLALLLVSGVEGNSRMLRYRMRADLNDGVVKSIASAGRIDLIGAAVPQAPREQRWGWARHLDGFNSFASGARAQRAEDYNCEDAREALRSNATVVVVSRDRGCGRLSGSSVAIDRSTTRAGWPYIWERHPVSDRVYVTRGEQRVVKSAVRPVQAPL